MLDIILARPSRSPLLMLVDSLIPRLHRNFALKDRQVIIELLLTCLKIPCEDEQWITGHLSGETVYGGVHVSLVKKIR